MLQQTKRLAVTLVVAWGLLLLSAWALVAASGLQLDGADWGVAACPLLGALMGSYTALSPPKENHRMYWFCGFVVVGIVGSGFMLRQMSTSRVAAKQDQQKLLDEIASLKTITPLRKQLVELADEINKFSDDLEESVAGWYQKQFRGRKSYADMNQVPSMTDAQTQKMFDGYLAGVKEYHSRYDARILSLLDQVKTVTGKPVDHIVAQSNQITQPPFMNFKAVATSLTNLAGSLP